MTYLLKDPDAVLDYAIDWGAQYLGAGEVLSQSAWSIEPQESGGMSVAGSDFDDARATVKAAAGLAGRRYRLTNRIATQAGRTDERSIIILVESR